MSDPTDTVAALGLTVQSVPVPTPQPDAKVGTWQLHWRVTVMHNGNPILTTDYRAGCAHAPSYGKRPGYGHGKWSVDGAAAVQRECETMRLHNFGYESGRYITADPMDVLHCIVTDASAIDSPTFEDWAADFGYDPDSRKGEAIYRTCLEHGLKLRAAIGDDGLTRLREAFQNF